MARPVQNFFKALVMGKNDFILSNTQYKRVLLTGQLCLIAFTANVLYIVFDLASGIYYSWPYQLACAGLILAGWGLNRMHKPVIGNMVLGIGINLTVYLFTSVEQISTGLYMFYIMIAVSAFAVFGYEHRGKAFFIAGLSIVFFFLTLFTPLDILPQEARSESYTQINLVFNFLVCIISSVLILNFMLKIHYRSEGALKKNERKIRLQNDELTKINSELDRFVYSTSHDLRAPLSSIRGLIQLTERENNITEIRHYISLMKTRITNLDKFITDISDYSRNSRTEIVRTRLQVRNVVRHVLEDLSFYPGSESVKVEVDVADDIFISSDVTRLQMVIGNLVSNAFKYYDPAKEERFIKISAQAQPRQEGDALAIVIEDNGIGISPDYAPRIFEMFFQAHEKSTGSGLGLYIVKETVEKLGGTIAVDSAVDKGSQFTIRLPGYQDPLIQ